MSKHYQNTGLAVTSNSYFADRRALAADDPRFFQVEDNLRPYAFQGMWYLMPRRDSLRTKLYRAEDRLKERSRKELALGDLEGCRKFILEVMASATWGEICRRNH